MREPLELTGDHLCYVTSVKYLGVMPDASIFECLIDHTKMTFHRVLTVYLISQRLLILKLLNNLHVNDISFLLY